MQFLTGEICSTVSALCHPLAWLQRGTPYPDSRTRTARAYRFLDFFGTKTGKMVDYTEGYYARPEMTYEEAQRTQFEYILDHVGTGAGTSLLDVGCGNGNLMNVARERGASPCGVTISKEQMEVLHGRGLESRLCDVLELTREWSDPTFDAAVCIGSMEHFATTEDALASQDSAVYRRVFENLHAVVKPGGRVFTSCLHFNLDVSPDTVVQPPYRFPCGSDRWHLSSLNAFFGGWYPRAGQYRDVAQGLFALELEQDATPHYARTTAEWNARAKQVDLKSIFWASYAFLDSLSWDARYFADCLAFYAAGSWSWQFTPRPPSGEPPIKLLWQVWRRL